MPKTSRLDIRIEENDKAVLEKIAEKEGRSLSNLVQFIIQKYIREQK